MEYHHDNLSICTFTAELLLEVFMFEIAYMTWLSFEFIVSGK